MRRLRNEVAIAKGLVDSKGKSPICNDVPKDTQLAGASLPPSNSDVSVEVPSSPLLKHSPLLKQEEEIKEMEQLLDELKEKVKPISFSHSACRIVFLLSETQISLV